MAKQKSCHKFIYKLSSKRLKQARWNLTLPLETAIKNKNDVVALNDSQILRWICELNGLGNLDMEVAKIKKEIKCFIRAIIAKKLRRETINFIENERNHE